MRFLRIFSLLSTCSATSKSLSAEMSGNTCSFTQSQWAEQPAAPESEPEHLDGVQSSKQAQHEDLSQNAPWKWHNA